MRIHTISPRELAQATGVSESSVKRWVDAGRIPVSRTAGGHRRILMPDAVQFIRAQGMALVRPDVFGLPDLSAVVESDAPALTADRLMHAIRKGMGSEARSLLVQSYLAGTSPDEIFDGPVSEVMRQYGTDYLENPAAITYEHRFTALCIEALHQIRLFQPEPRPGALVALGGSPERDFYVLPSLMSAVVLAECGMETMNLGPQLPAASLEHAANSYEPRLVWLAVTSRLDSHEREGLTQTVEQLLARGVAVVVGGAGALQARWPEGVRRLASMRELAKLAAMLPPNPPA